MAGVLFVICIPREKYEKCISNKQQSSEEDGFGDTKISESYSSLSAQESSLNSNSSIGDGTKKDIKFKRREIQGSMDSEVFMRKLELETLANESEEACQKFYNAIPVKKSDKTMEFAMREIIERMKIRNVSWQKVNNGNSYKISFSLEKGVRCDDTIHLLSEHGIGHKNGSSCVIIPCSVYKDKSHLRKSDEDSSDNLFPETSWNQHIGNVRARLNVEKLVHAVKSDATMSFDFIILLIVASIIASFGLVENSTLILTASMLISPLMGPILAATLGAIIKNHKLQFWGLRNEIIGIVLCIVVGYFFGILVCVTDYIFDIQIKLTSEMLSRCTWRSVFIGVFIALASGAAQSIALLRENFGSLVGVAISASLLPPAVNTGLLWSFSNVNQVFQILDIKAFGSYTIEDTKYSQNPAVELLILGALSLFLTITNVICVYLMGYVFLRIKIEVAPLSTEEERQFWKHDIPIARDYNKTINAEDGRRIREQLEDYLNSDTENFQGVAAELLRQDLYPNTHTWSPLMNKLSSKNEQPRPSVIDFNSYYNSMAREHNRSNLKHSDPIKTPKASKSSSYHNTASSSEPVNRHTTFVEIEGGSNDDARNYGKFVVTPAKDDLL
ncbi:uncharacterized protein [Chironomus tepperi]|uniref:uncharacterized protein n=1 Tax=Chironomus tepperi TaxID=113505 RepID=UPI00391F712B